MRLTYIYHSGFVLETECCAIVFDYYRDPAGVMNDILNTDKRIYVMASHFHEDHFNTGVLEWKARHRDIVYLLSKDILRHRRAPKTSASAWLAKGGTFSDGNIAVRAFGSTDSGVSFMVETGGKRIFHAGDLNNWHWTDESSAEEAARAEAMFLGELKDIRKYAASIDVAMFPVDARIGTGYMRGAQQFAGTIRTGLFVPMHFTACGYDSARAFQPKAEASGCRFFCPDHEGQSIMITDI